MADAINKAIRKIRHKFKREEKIEPLWKKRQAERQADEYTIEFWERDKKIKRDDNFKKAQMVRKLNLEAARVEREAETLRQGIIADTRTKNLKKARRRLRWLRSNNE